MGIIAATQHRQTDRPGEGGGKKAGRKVLIHPYMSVMCVCQSVSASSGGEVDRGAGGRVGTTLTRIWEATASIHSKSNSLQVTAAASSRYQPHPPSARPQITVDTSPVCLSAEANEVSATTCLVSANRLTDPTLIQKSRVSVGDGQGRQACRQRHDTHHPALHPYSQPRGSKLS